MKQLSSYFKFQLKRSPRKVSTSLVSHSKWIWEGSIVFLVLLVVSVLLFDGYVFGVRIKQLEQLQVEAGPDALLDSVKNSFVIDAKALVQKRKNALEHSGENLPTQNPSQ